MELHPQDEVEDEKRLLAESAGHIVLLKASVSSVKNRSLLLTVRVWSYREPLREVEALRFEGGSVCWRFTAVGGAEESWLMESQLLQLLWILSQCGGEEQLLQRHLRWRKTERRRIVLVSFHTENTNASQI